MRSLVVAGARPNFTKVSLILRRMRRRKRLAAGEGAPEGRDGKAAERIVDALRR